MGVIRTSSEKEFIFHCCIIASTDDDSSIVTQTTKAESSGIQHAGLVTKTIDVMKVGFICNSRSNRPIINSTHFLIGRHTCSSICTHRQDLALRMTLVKII
jgi:hypothetical protein